MRINDVVDEPLVRRRMKHLNGGEKYRRMSGVGVLSKIGRQPPLLSSAANAFTEAIGTLSAAKAGPDSMVRTRMDKAFRITKPLT